MYQPNNFYPPQYSPQYQRLMQLEAQQQQQQQMQNPMMAMPQQMPQMNQFIKGRPVVSLEEARAAQIDLDGSLFVFTDIGNKKIYTKQINLDGTATLNIYALENTPTQTQTTYITKEEFDNTIGNIKQELYNQMVATMNEMAAAANISKEQKNQDKNKTAPQLF